jgi:hypothetical protein
MATFFVMYRLALYFSKLTIANEIASRPHAEETKLLLLFSSDSLLQVCKVPFT